MRIEVLLINFLLFLILGACIGRLMALAVQFLPSIIMSDESSDRPIHIFSYLFKCLSCSHCHHNLSIKYNLPFINWFAGKRCPYCKKVIKNYYLLEIFVCLMFGLSVLIFPISYELLFVLLINCLLICCFITDYEHNILPDQFTLSIVWIALIGSILPMFVTSNESIIGAIVGYGLFWFLNLIFKLLRRYEGIFPGDFKLNAGVGACFGWRLMIEVVMFSMIFLVIFTIGKAIFNRKENVNDILKKEIPYGCFCSIVTIIGLYLFLYYKMVHTGLTLFF